MNCPVVSIVVPVTKCAFLPATLASIKAQDYPNIEVVVVNNCADGDVSTFVKRAGLANAHVHDRPEQLPALQNWNSAVRLSSGKFVIVLSDDDELTEGAISSFVSTLLDTNISVAYGGIATVNEDSEILTITANCPRRQSAWGWVHQRLLGHVNFLLSNFMFEREAFERVGGFDENGPTWGSDVYLGFLLAMDAGQIAGVESVVLKYRSCRINMTSHISASIKISGSDWMLDAIEKRLQGSTLCSTDFFSESHVRQAIRASRYITYRGYLYQLLPFHPIVAFKFFRQNRHVLSCRDLCIQTLSSLNKIQIFPGPI